MPREFEFIEKLKIRKYYIYKTNVSVMNFKLNTINSSNTLN